MKSNDVNLSPYKEKMNVQDSNIRKNNFEEVELGYSKEQALKEAKRCLGCKNAPCILNCPVHIDIPNFISEIKEENYEKAFDIIFKNSSLGRICGRVCPQEEQCEKYCNRKKIFDQKTKANNESVAIGRLERFVSDYCSKYYIKNVKNAVKVHKKVAIIGSGPSALSCASTLNSMGYDVTIFEALHLPGGVLTYGIPEFRLPKNIVQDEIEKLKNNGVKIECNVIIGKTITINELMKDYKFNAVFIGTGAGLPKFMGIKGENLCSIYSANELLTRVNLMKSYKENSMTPIKKGKKVVVVGGGNVAIDAARTALRLGADVVYLVYRRSFDEMPARKDEIYHAKEEGIVFKTLHNPVEFIGDNSNNVKSVKLEIMKLGEPDEKGRRRPLGTGEYEFLDIDEAIIAIGTVPNPLLAKTTNELLFDKRGCLIVDESLMTSLNNVYAGGDVVTGAATVISAMGAGKKAAEEIDKYLKLK